MKDSTSKCRINYNLIPLPLLSEQTATIELVKLLMTTSRGLEAEVEHASNRSAYLLQTVLEETFAK